MLTPGPTNTNVQSWLDEDEKKRNNQLVKEAKDKK